MLRTRMIWTFLSSLTLLAGRAALADEPPATGETGGQTYGGATYEKAGEAAPEETPAPQAEPAPVVPPAQQKTTVITPAPVMQAEPEEEHHGALLTPFGLSLAVGGGVAGFVDDTMTDLTDPGGMWDARLTIGSRLPVSIEAAYIGTAQSIDALGLDPDATLVSNGVEGALRLNIGTYNVQPFIFAGGAWQRYSLVGESFNTSSVGDHDDVFSLPMGVGLATKWRGFLVDLRANYRETWGNDLVTTPTASSNDDDVELNNWSANGRIGFEF